MEDAAPSEFRLQKLGEMIRRAFAEFLNVPVSIVGGFLLLAACTSVVDYIDIGWLRPFRTIMREYFFRDGQATSDLLATIAGGMITVTSITFSLLLLAVQQAASALTHQIYGQFLRRRINQVYFGFFVGLAVYTLVILATVEQPHNPVFGATVALLLTIAALMLLILLLYTTINQMRPVVVVSAIHDRTLASRECQLAWLQKTRRKAHGTGLVATPVRATTHGYVVRVDVEALAVAAKQMHGEIEIVLLVSVGAYLAFHDVLAEIRTSSSQDLAEITKAVLAAVCVEQQRSVDTDPDFGVEQLAIIGWTSISTAKSNPSTGLLVIHSLRDLLARWSAEPIEPKSTETSPEKAPIIIPVVYTDNVFSKLLDAFETLAVVASESIQPQTLAEIVRTFTIMFDRLPAAYQGRAEDVIRRSLSALGEHVLTGELDSALEGLSQALDAAGRRETAAQVRAAHEALRASLGKLGSRFTRVPH